MFDPFSSDDERVFEVRTTAPGPAGSLPLTEELLRESPSGDLFGLSQNVGMGWSPAGAADRQFLVLSTQGGLRAPDGSPVALGYHTGHWEIGLLVEAAALELRRLGTIPFAGACSDPCDGRTRRLRRAASLCGGISASGRPGPWWRLLMRAGARGRSSRPERSPTP